MTTNKEEAPMSTATIETNLAERAVCFDLAAVPETRATDDSAWDAEGWAVKYDVKDTWGTTFRNGCFSYFGPMEKQYPFLWMHRSVEVLGLFEVDERAEGLWIKVRYDETQRGQDARTMARSGSAPGCSVGFIWYPTPDQEDPDDIVAAELIETSQIPLRMQAVPGAELQSVRSRLMEIEKDPAEMAARAVLLGVTPDEAAAEKRNATKAAMQRLGLALL